MNEDLVNAKMVDRLFSTLDAERTNLETYALGPGNGMQSIQLSSAADQR
jgi:hypothetical protein